MLIGMSSSRVRALDDGDDAAQLFVGGDFGEAGARRLAADVDDVGAVLAHLDGLADGGIDVVAEAIAGERVRA